uniref:Uncharacterized protein n=1 Tax=Cacopsylla melanoneura TaxID=428564 RepID=A0A8D9EQA0_9HEMI
MKSKLFSTSLNCSLISFRMSFLNSFMTFFIVFSIFFSKSSSSSSCSESLCRSNFLVLVSLASTSFFCDATFLGGIPNLNTRYTNIQAKTSKIKILIELHTI